MPRTRIKICGITRPEDAALAAELGANYLGFNLLAGPRQITQRAAMQLLFASARSAVASMPKQSFVTLCAMSVSNYPSAAIWSDVLSAEMLRPLQIYSPNYSSLHSAKSLAFNWWMVRHVSDRESLISIAAECLMLDFAPSALLLDTASQEKVGGTGKSFNWHWIAESREAGELEGLPPIILAGGLNPDNVAEAIRIARPYAVDVSSGVEVAGKPGIKDPIKMRDFIQAAQAV